MKKIKICGKDIAKFAIVYDPADGESVKFASEELARYIELACGAKMRVMKTCDVTPLVYEKIKVGPSANSGSHDITGEEEFIIKCAPDIVRIMGGQPRGTIYGVYDFLEKEIGWRFFTSDCETLVGGDVDIPSKKRHWKPVFEWRDVCSSAYWPEDISVKRKLNSSYERRISAKRGGSFFYPGRFVHTMESLLGVPQHQQPCFSDPEVLEKCIASVRELLRANPEARIISVTQNDAERDEVSHCRCPRCAAIDEEEGSHAGTLLRFVNAVGEAIEDEFPKVKLITLAYLHTLKCPKITRPRRNVIIEFAPMEMNFVRPATDPCNTGFISEFEKWGKIADKIYIWDYIVDFSFTVPIFPNFGVIAPNLRYYAEHNVTGMFLEGDNYRHDEYTTDLAELRGYLLSLLMENPKITDEELAARREEFLAAYYGKNGSAVGKFVDIITEIASVDGNFVGCFHNPNELMDRDLFLSRLPEMEALWNEAEAGAETELQKSHCERSRLCYTYLKLLHAFDAMCENPDTRAAILEENEKFYRLLQKYAIRPRGMMSELPVLNDFTQNMAVKIYW